MQTILPRLLRVSAALLALAGSALAQSAGAYNVQNLISDGSVPAATTDANFINPWGVSVSPNWWISVQGSGQNYVVPTSGKIAFRVVIPAATGGTTATGSPTGSVTTAGAAGMILPNGTRASFLFSTLDGMIAGWNIKLGTGGAISQIAVNNSAAGAVYTGLAILKTTAGSYLLAPNFGMGNAVEVYDSTFAKAKLAGSFTDPTLPASYSPYSIHVLGGQVFVAYAQRSTTTPYQEVLGAGNGIVSVFDNTGVFVARIATGGNLNAPWGVAFAPANFGIYSNDLLIGNFGDGMINVFDPKTYAFVGQMIDGTGKPLVYLSLWDLIAGNTPISGGDSSTVYFTAGLKNESHGLFAGISNDSTTAGIPAFGMAAASSAVSIALGDSAQVPLTISPTYNFTGTVALSCSNLPFGVSCSFNPASVTMTGRAPSAATVTIQTNKASHALNRSPGDAKGIAFAALLPFLSLIALRRRSTGKFARLLGVLVVLLASATFFTGCVGGSYINPGTSVGPQNLTIVASSGSQTQQFSMAIDVH